MSSTSLTNRGIWLGAAFAALISALVNWAAMEKLSDSLLHKPADDPDAYVLIAHQLRNTGIYCRESGIPTAYRPPGYTLAIAPWCKGELPSARGIALFHLACAGATAGLTVLWGASLGLGRWSWLAGLIVAIDPLLIRQSTLIMSETFFSALFIGAIYSLTLGSNAGRSKWWLILSGVLWGLAALTRPIAIAVLASISLGAFFSGKRKEWVITALVALLTMLPWAIRNQWVFGRPIFTTTHGGYTLWLGQNPVFYREVVAGNYQVWPKESFDAWTLSNLTSTKGMTEIEQDANFKKEATTWMSDHPDQATRSILYHLRSFWSVSPRADSKGFGTVVTIYYVVFLLAIVVIGVRYLPRLFCWPGWIITFAVLSFTVVHAIYWSDMRMRAPLAPVLAVLLAGGCSTLGRHSTNET